MMSLWWSQILAIVRLELKKTFFARRGLWIYLLAAAPIFMFAGHSITATRDQARRHNSLEGKKAITREQFTAVHSGMKKEQVVALLGEPFSRRSRERRHDTVEDYRYTDGTTEFGVRMIDGEVTGTSTQGGCNIGEDSVIFAGIFEFFYLRLAIFFGCLGIFMNLFRGEMLDKSLHFYLLAPIRREVLLAGKYVAGLVAAIVIFTTSAALQMLSMAWHWDSAGLREYLTHGHGYAHALAYLGVTALACVGYGSVFLAAGLLMRNPIIPAAAILVWEAMNPFLPQLLKKFSVIYYLKSLCPVDVPVDPDVPPTLALLISNADPIAAPLAILGVLAVAAGILVFASFRVRRLEINYSTE